MAERVDLDAFDRAGEYASSEARWSAEAGVVRCLDGAVYTEVCTAVRDADAEWIATADPQTVAALVAELRDARRVLDAIQGSGVEDITWLRRDGLAQYQETWQP